MVQDRAKLLGVSKCYVGREAKITVLKEWCNELKIDMSEVAFIGDDVNDIEILNHVFHHANREYDEEGQHDDVEVLGERGLLG